MHPSSGYPRAVERSSDETEGSAQATVRADRDCGRPALEFPTLAHLEPGVVLESRAEVLRAPSGFAAPIAPHGLGGPIAGVRRVVSAVSRLPWPAGCWGHERRGVRGKTRAKFRGRPSAPSRRWRLPFSSFLPAQVVSGCGLLSRPAPPASQHRRPHTCCGRSRLPPCPPRKLLLSRQNPRKGEPQSSGYFFLFVTGGSFSWSTALQPGGPLYWPSLHCL